MLRLFQAWVGHPYVDIVDNSSDFESKIRCLISKVAWTIGIDIGDRLTTGAKKLKFVVNGPLPSEKVFPEGFRDFEVRGFFWLFLGICINSFISGLPSLLAYFITQHAKSSQKARTQGKVDLHSYHPEAGNYTWCYCPKPYIEE